MLYKTIKLNVDERIYSQVIDFLKLLPANQCIIDDEPKNQLTLQQRFLALAGSWEGEELQRAPQETIFPSLKKLRDSLPASKINAADLISQMRDQESLLKQSVEDKMQTPFKKLNRLKKRDCIVGDPEDLVHIEWQGLQ